MDNSPQLKIITFHNSFIASIPRIVLAMITGLLIVLSSSDKSLAAELISFSDLNRLGAFRVPVHLETNAASGGIEIDPVNNSFYLVGHERRNYVAELSLPSSFSDSSVLGDLSTATLLQDFQPIRQRVSGGASETIDRIAGLKFIVDSADEYSGNIGLFPNIEANVD